MQERYGRQVVCEVGDWEDDALQLVNPCSAGGANRQSLAEAQEEAIERFPISTSSADGIGRNRNWRPLTRDETDQFLQQSRELGWFNNEVFDVSGAYWMTGGEDSEPDF